jgi:D-alanyl-D-alanine carboxypeptidase
MYRNVALLDNTFVGTTHHKALFTSTTANADNNLFTHTTNRLTYTGTMTKVMHTAVTFSVEPDSNANTVFEVTVHKNGVQVPGAVVDISTVTTGVSVGNALHSAFRMSTNDYVEVWIGRLSGTANATMTQMNFFAGAMGVGL